MLSKRFKNNGKAILCLNALQKKTKTQIEEKIKKGIYSFEKAPCCICNNSEFEVLSEKDHYGLYCPVVICRNCGLIQTNPRMNQISYNQFYDIEYRKLYIGKDMPTDDFFRFQYNRGKKIYKYLEKNLRINLSNLKILEVGAGTGGILQYFKEKDNAVLGIDLDSQYIAFGREKYNLNLQVGTLDNVAIPWIPDIVIYSHVLEHLLDPLKEMKKLRSIIRDHSYVYIEVPGLKFMKRYCGGDFLYWVQNAHIYYFTLRTLKNLMRNSGYKFIYGEDVTNIYSIFKKYPSLSETENKFENDYNEAMSFLRKMEWYRFFPTPDNISFYGKSVIVKLLKKLGLGDFSKRIYYKIKH